MWYNWGSSIRNKLFEIMAIGIVIVFLIFWKLFFLFILFHLQLLDYFFTVFKEKVIVLIYIGVRNRDKLSVTTVSIIRVWIWIMSPLYNHLFLIFIITRPIGWWKLLNFIVLMFHKILLSKGSPSFEGHANKQKLHHWI